MEISRGGPAVAAGRMIVRDDLCRDRAGPGSKSARGGDGYVVAVRAAQRSGDSECRRVSRNGCPAPVANTGKGAGVADVPGYAVGDGLTPGNPAESGQHRKINRCSSSNTDAAAAGAAGGRADRQRHTLHRGANIHRLRRTAHRAIGCTHAGRPGQSTSERLQAGGCQQSRCSKVGHIGAGGAPNGLTGDRVRAAVAVSCGRHHLVGRTGSERKIRRPDRQ